MITEKQIEKHKFFTTDGADIWRVKAVSTFTLVELINCETGGTASARVGEKSAGGFVPVRMPEVKNEGRVTKTKKKAKVKTASTPGRRRGAGKKANSKYLGVVVKTRPGGNKKFTAQATRAGKYAGLGTYNTEEAAAAAVQEHLGNTEEAARLRRLVEAKTDQEIRQLKEDDKVTAWDCKACGHGYKCKPDQCGKCSGRSFIPARPETKAESEVT